MDDGAAAVERAAQSTGVADVADAELDRKLAECERCLGGISDQRPYLPAILRQLSAGMDANQSRRTCYENRFFLIRRERLWLLGDCRGGSFISERVRPASGWGHQVLGLLSTPRVPRTTMR